MLTEKERQLQQAVDQLSGILQVRAVAHFNELVNCIEIRKQQAVAGDQGARRDLASLLQALDTDSLRAAALGIATPGKDGR